MKQLNFEDHITRLEEIVDKMESGDLKLDESLKYYEEGIKLSRKCYAKLNEAEKKIEKLIKTSDVEEENSFKTETLNLFDNEQNT